MQKFASLQHAKNAVLCAKENGIVALTCGLTYFAEDIVFNGIRNINTGSWTAKPIYYILVADNSISLKTFQPTSADNQI